MRVLHLIDPGSPGGGACTLRLLAEVVNRLGSVDADVIVVGNRAHADLARRCGVWVTGVLHPPLNHPAFARRALARTIRFYENAYGAYDVVHAWTLQSAMLASLAAAPRRRMATLTVGPVGGFINEMSVRRLDHGCAPLLASSTAVAQEYRTVGIDDDTLSVLAPAVNPESVEPTERDVLRRRWEIDDETFVLGLLSEPVCWADARSAMNVVLRVAATGRSARLVLHPAAIRRVEVEQWTARLGRSDLMIVEDDVAEPWRVVRGLDAALLIGGDLDSMDLSPMRSPLAFLTGGARRIRPMPGIMPLLWAMSAGIPVIAEASDAVRDCIEDGLTGLLVQSGDVNAASDRVMRIHDDRTIAGRIGMNAREHVRRHFNVSAYCVQLKAIYERLAGRAGRAPVPEETEREVAGTPIPRVVCEVS